MTAKGKDKTAEGEAKVAVYICHCGGNISDQQIVDWANDKLRSAGKASSIGGLKDPKMRTAVPLLELIDAVRPGSVDFAAVGKGESGNDALSNAKYAISAGRKIGAVLFALPEDITEVKPKMVLVTLAALMAVDQGVA